MKKVIAIVLVLAVIVVVVAMRVSKRGDETPARSIEEIHASEGVPVDVVALESGAITVVREIVGEVVGFRQSVLRASGDYKIASLSVREGERVRRGQTLLSYDVDISPDNMARLDQAREAYENARRQVDRLEPLFGQGAVAESDLDAARTQLAIAEADLRNARLELEVASPIDGVATAIAVSQGDVVESGDVVAQVAVLDSVRVVADVSSDTAHEVRRGAEVRLVVVREGRRVVVRGRVSRVALAADPATRLFNVEATMDNQSGALRPGEVVTLDVIVGEAEGATVVPRAAVLDEGALTPGGDCRVYVVAENAARLTTLSVGLVTGDAFEATSGVAVGTHVVVFGANRLEDGVKVRLHRVDGELVEAHGTADEGAADR
jgi:membrane fusion protein (multidrug efflux system)